MPTLTADDLQTQIDGLRDDIRTIEAQPIPDDPAGRLYRLHMLTSLRSARTSLRVRLADLENPEDPDVVIRD